MAKRKLGLYFDKNGVEISMQEMAALRANEEYSTIRRTVLPNGSLVSTVWLGIDHGYQSPVPIVFETMSFKRGESGEIDWGGVHSNRYATEEEAIKGHEEIVKLMMEEIPPRSIDLT